jgi:hypothetical protein
MKAVEVKARAGSLAFVASPCVSRVCYSNPRAMSEKPELLLINASALPDAHCERSVNG